MESFLLEKLESQLTEKEQSVNRV